MSPRRCLRFGLAISTFLLAAVPPAANAANADSDDRATFATLDVNEDGRLSGTEAVSLRGYDADGDGRITLAEFLEGRRKDRLAASAEDEKLFTKLDITEDGWLSGTESHGLESYDTDRDGEITKEEFLAGRAAARGGKMPSTEQLAAEAKRLFARLDITEDGWLTGTERQTVPHYDVNSDGRITWDEFRDGYLREKEAASQEFTMETFLLAVRERSARKIVEQMSPELRPQVEEPVLQFLLDAADAQLGAQLDRPAEVEASETETEGIPLKIYTATVVHAKGKVVFTAAFQQGLLVLFNMQSDDWKELDRRLAEQLTANKAFMKMVADYYAPRGGTILKSIFAAQDRQAHDLLHPALQKELPFDKARETFASARTSNGALDSLEFESLRTDFNPQGDLTGVTLEYALQCENGPATGKILIKFIGYQAAVVGFGIERSVVVDQP